MQFATTTLIQTAAVAWPGALYRPCI